MTRKDQVFIVDMVVIDLMQETMALTVISQPVNSVAKLCTIANIRKYSELHERHHFILMAMKVHSTFGHVMDRFIRECARLFHDR
jgi:hypothetical protein